MKRVLVACLLAATSIGVGCGSSESDQQLSQSQVRLKAGASFDDAQRCGVDLPQCTGMLSCVVVELEGQSSQALCVDPQSVCDQLECAQGSCGVLESYPARVVCMGSGSGSSDGDGSVSHSP